MKCLVSHIFFRDHELTRETGDMGLMDKGEGCHFCPEHVAIIHNPACLELHLKSVDLCVEGGYVGTE